MAQRQKGRLGCIVSVDIVQFRKDKISLKRSEQTDRRRKMVSEEQEASTSQAVLVASSSSGAGEEMDGDGEKDAEANLHYLYCILKSLFYFSPLSE